MSPPTEKKSTRPASGVEATIRAFDGELHGFLLRRLRGIGESPEDVKQEIYLRILRFTDTDLVREPRAYLYRVARNVLHDKLLLVERERERSVPDVPAEGVTEDQTRQVDLARDLNRILSQLPPLYRAILLLRTNQGMSYLEIAEELKLSVHTVKKYMHSALVQCRSISLELNTGS